jgi:hypothetical protein
MQLQPLKSFLDAVTAPKKGQDWVRDFLKRLFLDAVTAFLGA